MGKTILVADDMRFNRAVIGSTLMSAGYEVIAEADNGRDAVLLYSSMKPDAVVLDIQMPLMNGIDALTAILEIDPEANVVMCSSALWAAKSTIELGAKGFVAKNRIDTDLIPILNGIFAQE